jgi:hypothetical protein
LRRRRFSWNGNRRWTASWYLRSVGAHSEDLFAFSAKKPIMEGNNGSIVSIEL